MCYFSFSRSKGIFKHTSIALTSCVQPRIFDTKPQPLYFFLICVSSPPRAMHFLFFLPSLLQKKQRSFKQHKTQKKVPFSRVLLFVSTTEEFFETSTQKTNTQNHDQSLYLLNPTEEFSNACGRPTFCFNPIGIFRTRNQKTPPFLLLVLLFPVFSSHTIERKRQITHPHS